MTEHIGSRHQVDDYPASARSLVDEWIDEVGQERVVAVVNATIRSAHDGSIPSFTKKEDILADWTARYPRR